MPDATPPEAPLKELSPDEPEAVTGGVGEVTETAFKPRMSSASQIH